MAEKKAFGSIKDLANKGLSKIDTEKIKESAERALNNEDNIIRVDTDKLKAKASKAGDIISSKASDVKQRAVDTKEDLMQRIGELDAMLSEEITRYNDAYTLMNDKGMQLYVERSNAANELGYVEALVNSIANRPKEFDADFEEININRKGFRDACSFASEELMAARTAAGGAGAGIAAGASVVFMGPTAAMWVATTFGTASTGAAISTLSGAAATNAALAWLGGGTLAAGGGGITAGNALLAMAGPVGWSIAGATLLTSIVLFAAKRNKLSQQKNDEIESVKENTLRIKKIDAQIAEILNATSKARMGLFNDYQKCFAMAGGDYSTFSNEDKMQLGALVNNAKTVSALFGRTVEEGEE